MIDRNLIVDDLVSKQFEKPEFTVYLKKYKCVKVETLKCTDNEVHISMKFKIKESADDV